MSEPGEWFLAAREETVQEKNWPAAASQQPGSAGQILVPGTSCNLDTQMVNCLYKQWLLILVQGCTVRAVGIIADASRTVRGDRVIIGENRRTRVI